MRQIYISSSLPSNNNNMKHTHRSCQRHYQQLIILIIYISKFLNSFSSSFSLSSLSSSSSSSWRMSCTRTLIHKNRVTFLPSVSSIFSLDDDKYHDDKDNGKTLFIFGNGNVAQSVIHCIMSQSEYDHLNITSTTRSKTNTNNGFHHDFDTIICTYYPTLSSSFSSLSTSSSQHYPINVHFILYTEDSILHALELYSNSISHFLITIPPQSQTQEPKNIQSSSIIYKDIILSSTPIKNHLLSLSKHHTITFMYISTTGVYGNQSQKYQNGQNITKWITENTKPNITQKFIKAYSYFNIESEWITTFCNHHATCSSSSSSSSSSSNSRVCIFRCSGLYGNQFSALHTIRKNGWSNIPTSQLGQDGYNNHPKRYITSRVHLDDVGRTILAYMIKTKMTPIQTKKYHYLNYDIINISDNHPSSRDDVMNYAYTLLRNENITVGVATINDNNIDCDSNKISSERKKRRIENDVKFVKNSKMKWLLRKYGGLKYPSYRQGLIAVLKNNRDDWKNVDSF